MKINCLVIDHLNIDRMLLVKMLETINDVVLLDDFSNAVEAKSFLARQQVDLMFIETDLPVINGFDFLDDLNQMSQVIFLSHQTELAYKAFDYNATDYLLKPINENRLILALQKAQKRLQCTENTPVANQYLMIKINQNHLKVFFNQIKWIQADGDYLKIITDNATLRVLTTMKNMQSQLSLHHFFRVHKSYIVNLNKILEYNSKYLRIDDMVIPISIKKLDLLKKKIWAIGQKKHY